MNEHGKQRQYTITRDVHAKALAFDNALAEVTRMKAQYRKWTQEEGNIGEQHRLSQIYYEYLTTEELLTEALKTAKRQVPRNG